jgi:hypothetical protein
LYFVENEDSVYFAGLPLHRLEKTTPRGDNPAIAEKRFGNDGCHRGVDGGGRPFYVVERHANDVWIGVEKAHAVIASVEQYDATSARPSASEAQREEDRFGARVREPHHVHGWIAIDEHLRES